MSQNCCLGSDRQGNTPYVFSLDQDSFQAATKIVSSAQAPPPPPYHKSKFSKRVNGPNESESRSGIWLMHGGGGGGGRIVISVCCSSKRADSLRSIMQSALLKFCFQKGSRVGFIFSGNGPQFIRRKEIVGRTDQTSSVANMNVGRHCICTCRTHASSECQAREKYSRFRLRHISNREI